MRLSSLRSIRGGGESLNAGKPGNEVGEHRNLLKEYPEETKDTAPWWKGREFRRKF